MTDKPLQTATVVKHVFGKTGYEQDIRVEFCFYGIKEDMHDGAKHPKRETREITLKFIAVPLDMRMDVHEMLDHFSGLLGAWMDGFTGLYDFDMAQGRGLDALADALFMRADMGGWHYAGLLLDGNPPTPANLWELVFHAKKLQAKSRLARARPVMRNEPFPQAA